MAKMECAKCGGTKYSKGGTAPKKMAKGGMPTKVLGPAKKPFAAGIPFFTGAGQTGPESMKKGGSVKKLAKAQSGAEVPLYSKPLSSKSAKLGVGIIGSGIIGMAGKAIANKVKAKKAAKKASEEKKISETPKAKFGASVKVQHSPAPGRVRSSSGVGTVPVGMRKKKGGSVKK